MGGIGIQKLNGAGTAAQAQLEKLQDILESNNSELLKLARLFAPNNSLEVTTKTWKIQLTSGSPAVNFNGRYFGLWTVSLKNNGIGTSNNNNAISEAIIYDGQEIVAANRTFIRGDDVNAWTNTPYVFTGFGTSMRLVNDRSNSDMFVSFIGFLLGEAQVTPPIVIPPPPIAIPPDVNVQIVINSRPPSNELFEAVFGAQTILQDNGILVYNQISNQITLKGFSPLNFDFKYYLNGNLTTQNVNQTEVIIPLAHSNSHRVEIDYTYVPVGITPSAPTLPVVNDDDNTFGFTLNPMYILNQHEFRIRESGVWGDWLTCTQNPIPIGNINLPIGDIQVRVKALNIDNPSASISNLTAYNYFLVDRTFNIINKFSNKNLEAISNNFPLSRVFNQENILLPVNSTHNNRLIFADGVDRYIFNKNAVSIRWDLNPANNLQNLVVSDNLWIFPKVVDTIKVVNTTNSAALVRVNFDNARITTIPANGFIEDLQFKPANGETLEWYNLTNFDTRISYFKVLANNTLVQSQITRFLNFSNRFTQSNYQNTHAQVVILYPTNP